jgi:hypothetical protein
MLSTTPPGPGIGSIAKSPIFAVEQPNILAGQRWASQHGDVILTQVYRSIESRESLLNY